MDRNLGASRAATSPTDVEAYGDLYQWGRYSDGHEKLDSSETALNDFSPTDDPGHGNFILTNSDPYDWRSPQNDNLWQDSGINNPCPAGFRLPTSTEWEAEIDSWPAGGFSNPLKLVIAGYRDHSDGSIKASSAQGFYWSSTVDGSNSWGMYWQPNSGRMGYTSRADGFSVRCLKD